MRVFPSLIAICAGMACVNASQAAVVWDEAVSGDFSNSGSAPTAVLVAAGANQVFGTTGAGNNGVDLDYLTIAVPSGYQLTALTFLAGTQPADGGLGFLGIQAGPQVTGFGASTLLGWIHFSTPDVGVNLLPFIGQGSGAIGFSGALPAGAYSFWIQDFDFGVSTYRFEVTISAVPEPSRALSLAAGLALLPALGGLRRRRSAAQN